MKACQKTAQLNLCDACRISEDLKGTLTVLVGIGAKHYLWNKITLCRSGSSEITGSRSNFTRRWMFMRSEGCPLKFLGLRNIHIRFEHFTLYINHKILTMSRRTDTQADKHSRTDLKQYATYITIEVTWTLLRAVSMTTGDKHCTYRWPNEIIVALCPNIP